MVGREMTYDEMWGDNLDIAEMHTLNQIPKENIHCIHFIPIGLHKVQVHVFYHTNDDLAQLNRDGFSQQFMDLMGVELNKLGIGEEQGIQLRYEFDSHENVVKNFAGNYYHRLK